MAAFFDTLSEDHIAFIERQPIFFTATAAADGRINLSPKGQDSFRVIAPSQCAFLNLTGSGNETAAHLLRDGRITIMFNSFDKKPLILRIYGKGHCAGAGAPEFEQHISRFPDLPGARQIVFIKVESVQTSCGFAVPEMELDRHRPVQNQRAEEKSAKDLADYWRKKNTRSIDGFATGIEGAGG